MLKQQKRIYFEVLRIIACFFVIFNHTGKSGFFLFSLYPESSVQYWAYMFVSVFCKFSVPMFFAISGALLLPKEESIKDVYRKRILRMVIVLAIFSFACYLFYLRGDFSQFSLTSFFSKVYQSEIIPAYWYLYAFIPYLMFLPLLRPMVKNMKNEHFLYMFIIGIFFLAVLPVVEYLLWQGDHTLNPYFNVAWITVSSVIYPCLGYYLENRMDINKAKKYIPVLWIVNVATICLTCFMTYYRANVMGFCNENNSQYFHASFVMINVITLYITFKYLFSRPIKPKIATVIISVGGATFGIYLIHGCVITALNDFHVMDTLRNVLNFNYLFAVVVFCILVFLISFGITFVMKKIPLLKRLI